MNDTRRVLVIDDSTTVCSVVEKILRSCGFEKIEVMQDGKAALSRMIESPFHIIICDWEMEPMSGVDILKEVRSNPITKSVSFILMSAKKEPHWIMAAKKAGADSMLTKPFDAHTLKSKIAQLTR